MAIEYALYKSSLSGLENRWSAAVRAAGSAGLDQIADRIVAQGTTVRRADVLAVLENAIDAADSLLKDGIRVQLGGLVNLFPRISGLFDGPTDTYDPSRHKVDIAAMPGKRLRKSFCAAASVYKTAGHKPSPSLVAFGQTPAPAQAGLIIPGAIGTINGWRLKFDVSSADEGIYFCPADGTDPIKAASIHKNAPKELIFLVPPIPAGTVCCLEVRARIRGGLELRTGRLDGTLSIQ